MHYVPDLPEDLLCPLPTLCLCTQRVPCLRLSAMNAPMQERGTSRANVHRDRGAAAGEGARCLVTADMGVVPVPWHQYDQNMGGGGHLRRARTARSRCGEYTRHVLSVTPLPKGPLGRANALATKVHQNPSPPQTQRTQEHNTIGTRFAIVEMALGALRPFAVPGTPPPPLAQAWPRSPKTRQNSGSTPTRCLDKAGLACDTHDRKRT